MSREIKLALILGAALILVVGVLISDHFSEVRRTPIVSVVPQPPLTQLGSSQPRPGDARPVAYPGADTTHRTPLANTEIQSPLTDPATPQVAFGQDVAGAPLTDPVVQQSEQVVAEQDKRLIDEAKNQGIVLAPPSQTQTAQSPGKTAAGAKEHTVKSGENLWEIAQKYYGDGSQYKRIVEANRDRLSSGAMSAGVKLRIPPKDPPAPAQTAQAKSENKPADPKADKQSPRRTYTVRDGDTLARIAERQLGSRSRASELAALNNLKDPNDISIGLELRLPPR